ncbi:MAG TPA: ORF6N domain-containing protein [Bacteroidia bacterium]|jgi:hypothetical protein|nr:ORF6N domain-containing protein [Bacteroidia bacterium]
MGKLIKLTDDTIANKIYLLRGKRVMMDRDLAEMYGVEVKNLKRQVRRNLARFPEDFMFTLSEKEFINLRSQIGTSSWGGVRYSPMVFTEQGVAMLSSVLNSEQSIAVNIQIMRIFTKMREMLSTHKDILLKLEHIEKKMYSYDNHLKKHEEEIQLIFQALKELLNPVEPPRKRIGYRQKSDKD